MNAVPRVLMLPGYTQNATIMSGKMGAIRRAVKDSAELVFVDPVRLSVEDPDMELWLVAKC